MDLKAENILIGKDGNFKVGDLGIARPMNGYKEKLSRSAGTTFWMSKEMQDDNICGKFTDIWGIGVTLHHMCSVNVPLKVMQPSNPLIVK